MITATPRLQPGWRIRRKRRPLWLGVTGLAIAGIVLGGAITAPATLAWSGTALVVLGALAAAYRPSAGIAVFAFSLPFGVTANLGPWTVSASALMLAVVVVSWIPRAVTGGQWGWRSRRLDVAVALFAAATILSLAGMMGGMDRQLAALWLALTGFLVYLLTSRAPQTAADIGLIVGALVAATIIQATSIAGNVLTGNLVVSEPTRVSAELADPNHFAGILVLVCLLVVAVGIGVPTFWSSIPTGLASLALSVALLATLSRSGWLGLLAGLGVLFALMPERRRQLLAIAGAVTLILLVAGLASPVSARLAPHATGPWEMLASRWRVWTAAIAMWADHPVFGVGLDNFRVYYPLYSVRPTAVDHAHNLFLNLIAERGMLALLTFINLAVAYFVTVGRAMRRVGSGLLRALSAGLIASLAGYLVHSLFDVSYYDSQVLFLVWILIGLAAALPSIVAERALLPSAVDAPAEQQ